MGIIEKLDDKSTGLIPASINYIFQALEEDPHHEFASVCISMVQVYKANVYDLLDPKKGKVQVKEDVVSDTLLMIISGIEEFLYSQFGCCED